MEFRKGMLVAKLNNGTALSGDEREIVNNCTRNVAILTGQIDNGKVTLETYVGYLKMQLEKDKKIFETLMKLGRKEQAALIKKRMDLISQEMQG